MTPQPVDTVYATAVLSPTRSLAVFYWGRAEGYGKPLLLLDFTVAPLDDQSWRGVSERLTAVAQTRTVRKAVIGLFVEGEALAAQARGIGLNARPVPAHLTKPEMWHSMCQAVAAHMSAGSLGYTQSAAAMMDARPFLDAAGVASGSRDDDPLVPAFLYGVVIGLDPVLARDPHPKPPVRASAR